MSNLVVAAGRGVLLYFATNAQYTAMRWLLKEAGASIDVVGIDAHHTVWNRLNLDNQNKDAVEFSILLKVMVVLEDAPALFITNLSPQHVELCTRGKSSEHSYLFTSSSNELRSSLTALCPPSCKPSSSCTPRPPPRTRGQMDCAPRPLNNEV
jgi:hypothetical protein